jgi:hypothetical protein
MAALPAKTVPIADTAGLSPATRQVEPLPALSGVWLLNGVIPLPDARRLLVLVPAGVSAEALARRAWELAAPAGLQILYLGLAPTGSKDYAFSRDLATLAALTRDERVHAEACLLEMNDWIAAVRSLWRPGDVVICHSEQRAPGWHSTRRALAWELDRRLQVPVCVIAGLYAREPSELARRVRRILHDLVGLLVIALFFFVQIQIEQLPKNWAFYALYVLVVAVEIGVLFVWYTVFRD